MANTNPEDLLNGLTDMFQYVTPDREYLEENEDVKEDVKRIQELLDDTRFPVTDKISALHSFNTDWFPDELDEDEQSSYKELLDSAETLLKS